jgi:hypothetical protein
MYVCMYAYMCVCVYAHLSLLQSYCVYVAKVVFYLDRPGLGVIEVVVFDVHDGGNHMRAYLKGN